VSAADPAPAVDLPVRLSRTVVVKRIVVVAVAGVALYLVLPSLLAVFNSFPHLRSVNPVWFAVALLAEIAHFVCTFALQRLALRTRAWFAVSTAVLAGNGITLIVPGGAAAGAAVQFKMLRTSGVSSADAVGGLSTFSLLTVGGLLALPLFALPVIIVGVPVRRGLFDVAVVGAVAFCLFAGFGAVLLTTHRLLRALGTAGQWLWNHVVRRRPVTGVVDLLEHEREIIRQVLGRSWRSAVLLTAGRLFLDFFCLLCMVRATGADPEAALVLLAYAVAGVIGLFPVTPGGLGVVEASLSGLLILTGMSAGDALVATLAYRLASYWLPLAASPVAYGVFRRRYSRSADVAPTITSEEPT
jgi:uncharacterized protein (TIRG00374 family)